MVPDAAAVVHALASVGDEGAQVAGRHLLSQGRNHHDEGLGVQRHEGLAAQGMALHARQLQGQRIGAGVEQVDQRMALAAARVHAGQGMVALGHAVIDQQRRVACTVDDLAKLGKGFGGQRLDAQAKAGGAGL